MSAFQKKLACILLALAVLAPLGIYLPAKFNAGGAWGEWSSKTIGEMLGFVPAGLAKGEGTWKAPVPDYSFGGEDDPPAHQALWYVASALIGAALCMGVFYGVSRFLAGKKR
jgi:cobalt/nickel transport protein